MGVFPTEQNPFLFVQLGPSEITFLRFFQRPLASANRAKNQIMLLTNLSRIQPKLAANCDLPWQYLYKYNIFKYLYSKTWTVSPFAPRVQEYTINYFRMTNRSSVTLMLQNHSEEKRVRGRQMWPRVDSDMMNST